MLAGGFDRSAARWAPVIGDLKDAHEDKAWAMLALGAPDGTDLGIDKGRFRAFARRDDEGPRSRLLLAGLAGLDRLSVEEVNDLNSDYKMGLGKTNQWTELIDGAAARGQQGTVILLAAMGTQAGRARDIDPAYLFHAVRALRMVGLDFRARMMAAEALARS